MIISRTPYRISFFGGGTDYPEWYRVNGGQVLSTAINRYLHISCRYLPPFFDHKIRLAYSVTEECEDFSQIDHPSVREVLRFLQIKDGLEIHFGGDLPGRSGTGSSSACTVGMLNALYAFKNETISSERLANESINIEQNIIGEIVGSQDQISAAYGGFNHIKFNQDDSIDINPIDAKTYNLNQLDSKLMLFFTGIRRTAETVAKTYVEDLLNKEKQLFQMSEMVDKSLEILKSNDLDNFGRLLDEGWRKKKELSKEVSNQVIDDIYAKGIKCGALGGKISGAGGGGFVFFYVPEENQPKLKEALSGLTHVPFNFEVEGSKIILNQNMDYMKNFSDV